MAELNQPRQNVSGPEILSGKNTSGSTIPKGSVVKAHSVTDEVRLVAAATDAIHGVVMRDIADGEYGPIQRTGRALVLAAGALATPGTLLMSAAGKAGAWSASAGNAANVLGTQNTTADGADELIEVDLAGPGSFRDG